MLHILFVDDERHRVKIWIDRLETLLGAMVTHHATLSSALAWIKTTVDSPDLLIWDMTLTPPGVFGPSGETVDFDDSRAGKAVYRAFVARWPAAPTILLSNLWDDGIPEDLAFRAGLDERFEKRKMLPKALAEHVRRRFPDGTSTVHGSQL